MTKQERSAKTHKISYRLKQVIEVYKLSRFWTFTFFAEIIDDDKMKYWHRFIMALRKYHPKLQYFLIKELHPNSGRIHFHILFSEYVDWHLVDRLWQKAGCGKVTHVKKLDRCGIERYITKYMTKALDGLKAIRGTCYTSSRAFTIHLGSFPKWCLKVLSWGETKIIKFVLEKFDFESYYVMAGKKKRILMYQVHAICMSLEALK